MIWNVYERDDKEIKVFNIFDHYSFNESVKKLKKKKFSKEVFTEMLKRELMYYFWSKYEWEVVVTTFPPYINQKELDRVNTEHAERYKKYGYYPRHINITPEIGIKIDVYEQVMLNWDVFVDYVWEAKK